MFARLFRFLDRLGKFLIKVGVWLSDQLMASFHTLFRWSQRRIINPDFDSHAVRAETQVRSLSGVTVILLAGVVALIFWSTNSQAQGGIPVFQTPVTSGNQSVQPTDQTSAIVQVPQIHSVGTIVFSMMAGNQLDLFGLSAGQTTPIRLTDSLADDHDPAWSPDGRRLAFASRRDGNWELYILDMASGEIKRLTFDLVFEAHPSWSPDGLWLAYEGYYQGNLDIYIIKADASEGPYPVTHQPGPDFNPAWTSAKEGRTIAYVSNRDGSQDIYLISLDKPTEDQNGNLTNTPDINEDEPKWSPDGTQIAFSAVENGISLIETRSVAAPTGQSSIIGQGHSPAWSPDGSQLIYIADRPVGSAPTGSLLFTDHSGTWEGPAEAFVLPALASDADWTNATLPPPQGTLAFAATAPLPTSYSEPVSAPADPNGLYLLKPLNGIVGDAGVLNDRVDGSFSTLRDQANQATGWDFLGRLDNVWWPLNRPLEPGQPRQNWHKAGRAFDIVQAYNQGNPAQIELVLEQIGPEMYWRLFVRAAIQDGSLGEPLRSTPWDFASQTSGDVQAYEAGGKFKTTVPSGYYIDFTRLALSYGWSRTPSDTTWRYNWPGVLYWEYKKSDGLDWWDAMLELYPKNTLEQQYFTPTPAPTQPKPTVVTPNGTSTHSGTPSKPGVPAVTPTRTPIPRDIP